MIYGFSRQSGGQVRIHSEVGKGTTVSLYFPRHLGEVEDEPPAHASSSEIGFGETIVVVDDEDNVRMLIAETLAGSSYKVIEAADAASALKVLQAEGPVDVMITDVGLPGGLNGRQLADAGRMIRKGLKVLFTTGYAENAVIRDGQLEPGMEVLIKPFAMNTLAAKVREMLERGPRSDQGR
jgi:DNA-binding response OmpR family regulator